MRTVKQATAANRDMFTKEQCGEVFESIYKTNYWRTAEGSGIGSLPEYSRNFKRHLTEFLNEKDIKTVTDFGCGAWVVYQDFIWPDIDYTGVDVSDTALERARKNCKYPNFKFVKETDFNNLQPSDLLIVKEVVQHWPLDLVESFFESIKGKFKYVYVIGHIDYTLTEELSAKASWHKIYPHEKSPNNNVGYWLFENLGVDNV